MLKRLMSLLVATVTIASYQTFMTPDVAKSVNWQPCKYEDGSGQDRCIWDGRHMGNGQGISFKVWHGGEDDAVYKRIPHRRAHRLLGL